MSNINEKLINIENGKVADNESYLLPFENAFRALAELLAHTMVMTAILGSNKFLEIVIYSLWGSQERMLFDKIPLHYMFDAADAATIAGFLIYGIYSVIKKYGDR
jgi:hypothetical protein